MLKWALFFFIVAVVAGLFGFSGIAGVAATIAQVLFFAAVFFFFGALIMAFVVGKKVVG